MTRVIGLDPGTRRIGVAVSDTARTMAFPRPSVPAGETAVAELRRLVLEEGAATVVVGRPISLAGRDTDSTTVADELRVALVTELAPEIDVVAVDERLTTTTAQQRLASAGVSARAQRDRIDSAAAVVLLQAYLDALPR